MGCAQVLCRAQDPLAAFGARGIAVIGAPGVMKDQHRSPLAIFGHFCGDSHGLFWNSISIRAIIQIMKVVVLCSGGMDSVTALHWARGEHDAVAAVSFDYGSKHNAREIPCAAAQAAALGVRHQTIALPFVNELFSSALLKGGGEIPEGHYEAESMRRTVVPFRNAILLSIASGWAESVGAEGLVIAAHTGDHAIYPDCREEFMNAMGEAIKQGTYAGIRLLRPFIAMDKAAIVSLGTRLGVDFGNTWSCYKGGAIHCGRCGTCVERREAFARAGVQDPTAYEAQDPLPPKP